MKTKRRDLGEAAPRRELDLFDEMDRASGELDAGRERLALRMETGKGRQQGRMDVDQAALVVPHEGFRQHPHEAGQNYQIGPMPVDLLRQGGIEFDPVRMQAVIHHDGGHAVGSGDIQARSPGLVADDAGDIQRQVGFQQGTHIAAPAGDEDDSPHGHGRRVSVA